MCVKTHHCGPVLIWAVTARLFKFKLLQGCVCLLFSEQWICPQQGNPAHGHPQLLSTNNFSSFSHRTLPCLELQPPRTRLEASQVLGHCAAGKCQTPGGCKALERPSFWFSAAHAWVSQVSWWVKSVWFCGWNPGQHNRGAELLLHLSPASSASWSVYSHTRDLEKSSESCFLSNPAGCGLDLSDTVESAKQPPSPWSRPCNGDALCFANIYRQ